MPEVSNAEQQNPSYVALVAALRSEFNALGLESLRIQLADYRDNRGSLGRLVRAVSDAGDITYDAGESVHPAVRAYLDHALRGPRPTGGQRL
ncbi:hypothetical protein MED01_002329 [Micromonospora sp. MED01]|uniref:hypothetical protein n=1 Tax=Micromonospora alfalfae TaxID=2911212 RepID=UPI001EE9657C|nr:hypothetical protein [Micromonospora alfalfae]MCG5464164.1 hypothetical protein [Micromonospora alfalfae]